MTNSQLMPVKTKHCIGCSTHKALSDFAFYPTTDDKLTVYCRDCIRKRKREKDEGQVQESAKVVLRELILSERPDPRVATLGKGVFAHMGGMEVITQQYAEALQKSLTGDSAKGRIDAMKAIDRLAEMQDKSADTLRDLLGRLSEDDLYALGFEIIARGIAAGGGLEALEQLASQAGYRLIKDDDLTVEGSVVPFAEAS